MIKFKPTIILAAALLLAAIPSLRAQGTAFTYQARLSENGSGLNGLVDLEFRLFNAAESGAQVGPTLSVSDLAVSNGLVTAALDFGANFPGAGRWLQVALRPGLSTGAFTNLNPRQPLTSTPYAVRALEAAALPAGAVSAAMLADGAVTAAKIAPGAVSQLGAADGSPVNAVLVNTNGLVGVGTSSPQAGLHITSSQSFTNLEVLSRVQDESDGYTNLFGPVGLASWGSYLAVAGQYDSGVTLIDYSTPAFPQQRFQIRDGDGAFTNLAAARVVAMNSNFIAVAALGAQAVTLIGWSNPTLPVKLAELRDGVGGWNELSGVRALSLSGNLLAMGALNDSAVTLADISNPSAPVKRAEFKDGFFGYTNLSGVRSVALSGNLLAVAAFNDSTVTLVDVTNPGSPVKRAELTYTNGGLVGLDQPQSVALASNLLAVGNANGLTLFDVSNPASPALRGFWNQTPAGESLAFVNSALFFDGYLAVGSDSWNRIWVFDVRNPLAPAFLAQTQPNLGGVVGLIQPSGLAAVGRNLAVASAGDGFTNPGEVNLFSIKARAAGLSSAAWVGIGTTQPVAPLHVVGNVSVQQATRIELETVAFEAGWGTLAGGEYATALGRSSRALGYGSTALGYGSTALGYGSTALGYGSTALGYGSTALGFRTLASGDYATALGSDSVASGFRATASGHATTASGQNAFASGQASQAKGINSFASGENTLASELATTAMGYHTSATAPGAMAAGVFSKARHNNSFVWSDGTTSDFGSSSNNQFLINATGGVGIGTTNDSGAALTVQGPTRLNGPLVAANGLSVTGNVALSGNLTVAGTFNGNGGGLTSLNAANLTGSVADARLSANVALRAGGNSFTGDQNFSAGTLTANGTFKAVNNTSEGFEVSGAGAGYALLDRTTGAPGRWSMYANNGALRFFTGFTDKMVLNASGLTVNGTFVSASDRNLKENFEPVDAREVLNKVAALPLTRWNYKEDKSQRHVGPMAQDFHAAFGVGPDDKHIATIDESGVALAAIQGLNQKLEEQLRLKDAEMKAQQRQMAELLARLNALEEKLRATETK